MGAMKKGSVREKLKGEAEDAPAAARSVEEQQRPPLRAKVDRRLEFSK